MEKVSYLVVGDNNFWYTTTQPITEKELDIHLDALKEEIINGDYSEQPYTPNELYVYPLHVKMEKITISLFSNSNLN